MAKETANRRNGDSDVHRAKRRKNVAMLVALFLFVAVVYLVSIVRMGG
jgi:hypothetical protein